MALCHHKAHSTPSPGVLPNFTFKQGDTERRTRANKPTLAAPRWARCCAPLRELSESYVPSGVQPQPAGSRLRPGQTATPANCRSPPPPPPRSRPPREYRQPLPYRSERARTPHTPRHHGEGRKPTGTGPKRGRNLRGRGPEARAENGNLQERAGPGQGGGGGVSGVGPHRDSGSLRGQGPGRAGGEGRAAGPRPARGGGSGGGGVGGGCGGWVAPRRGPERAGRRRAAAEGPRSEAEGGKGRG